ncbi:MAG TPA: hypothetical protein VGO62_20720, partial [Myxococcota bacterium]
LVYRFHLEDGALRVAAHEELWSFGDMIAALPLLGAAYARAFRPLFARAFLLASRVCGARRGSSGRS